MSCDLCAAQPITRRYYADEHCWIADCKVCRVPMVVVRDHRRRPDERTHRRLMLELARVADGRFGEGGWRVDDRMRMIPDHYHAHARPVSASLPSRSAVPTPSVDPEASVYGWRHWGYFGGFYGNLHSQGPFWLTSPWAHFLAKGSEDLRCPDRVLNAAPCMRGCHEPLARERCSCGVYGWRSLEHAIDNGLTSVNVLTWVRSLGRVQWSREVLDRSQHAWRAEAVEILGIMVTDDPVVAHPALVLGSQWGVPVHARADLARPGSETALTPSQVDLTSAIALAHELDIPNATARELIGAEPAA